MATRRFARVMLWMVAIWVATGCSRPTPALEPDAAPTRTPLVRDTPAESASPTASSTRPPASTIFVPQPTRRRDENRTATPVPTTPTRAPEWTPQSPEERTVTEDQAIALAKDVLAKRLGITKEAISVEKVERTIWSDTSLGCPQKGMMYAQILTPGYQVMLRAGRVAYDMRIGANRALICPN